MTHILFIRYFGLLTQAKVNSELLKQYYIREDICKCLGYIFMKQLKQKE